MCRFSFAPPPRDSKCEFHGRNDFLSGENGIRRIDLGDEKVGNCWSLFGEAKHSSNQSLSLRLIYSREKMMADGKFSHQTRKKFSSLSLLPFVIIIIFFPFFVRRRSATEKQFDESLQYRCMRHLL